MYTSDILEVQAAYCTTEPGSYNSNDIHRTHSNCHSYSIHTTLNFTCTDHSFILQAFNTFIQLIHITHTFILYSFTQNNHLFILYINITFRLWSINHMLIGIHNPHPPPKKQQQRTNGPISLYLRSSFILRDLRKGSKNDLWYIYISLWTQLVYYIYQILYHRLQ